MCPRQSQTRVYYAMAMALDQYGFVKLSGVAATNSSSSLVATWNNKWRPRIADRSQWDNLTLAINFVINFVIIIIFYRESS